MNMIQQYQVSPSPSKEEFVEIEFPNAVIRLPKRDMKKWWKKAQGYMEVYLEDGAAHALTGKVISTHLVSN